MNAVELHEYMQNPDLLTEDTLADIRQTMNSYPTFPALKMLYLQNLWKVNIVPVCLRENLLTQL